MVLPIATFVTNESGATAIEYSLIASLIGLVIVTSVTALGTNVKNLFATVVSLFQNFWLLSRPTQLYGKSTLSFTFLLMHIDATVAPTLMTAARALKATILG